LPVAFGSGAFFGLVWMFIVGPIAKRRVLAKRAIREAADAEAAAPKGVKNIGKGDSEVLADDEEEAVAGQVFDVDVDDAPEAPLPVTVEPEVEPNSMFAKYARAFAANTYKRDVELESFHENHRAQEIWEEGEKFDEDSENLFTYMQVFTACLNSFAHGANDVSNTIAPMSAIIDIYQTGVVSSSATVDKWVLAYGGIAIVTGLLLYGYNVMKSIGFKLTLLSPSRGFSAELASSLVVVTASFNEIPVSSTQCIVGAVFGVGLLGGRKNVQWLFLLRVMCGWAVLFFFATIFAAGIFSFGAYSPSV
jgi:solute carrier family 20 (sodium-dependent phosphate transporter)